MSAPSKQAAPVTIITGGSSGIGLATAHLLREMGHRLALIARRPEPLEEARQALADDHPEEVLTIEADMGDPAWEGAIVHSVLDRFHRIDHIVHAAGYAPLASLEETTHSLLREVFLVNTLGPIELTRRALPTFQEQHKADTEWRGSVVTISSYAGADPFPGFLAYAGSKAAVDVMTRVLADELRPLGMNAYSVAPAAVETPMLRGLFDTGTVPEDACLDPKDVAQLVADCIAGNAPRPSGSTIYIKRTDQRVQITESPV